MAQVLTDESNYEDIADAIREMNGASDTYTPSEMAGAIRSIRAGVTGVKGNAESEYRSGDVNLTPENIGAASAADLTKVNYGLGTAIPLKSELEYPIKKGTHAFHGPSRSYQIYMANRDIADAEDDTSSAWTGPRTVASAYAGNVDLALKSLIAALAAAETQRLAMYPTDTAEGASVAISDGADNLPLKAMQLRIASESGVTGVSVTRLGKNVANIADNSYTRDGVTFTMSGGAVRMTGTSTGTINRAIGTARLLAGVTYAISGTKSSGITDANTLRIDLRNPGGSVIASGDSYNGFGYTPEEDVTAQVNIRLASGQTIDATLYPQVEAGQAATSYTPYAPTVYAVDWSDVAGTAHDVVLDVLTGALTADGAAYAVTPVDVRTLLGVNTFSSDAGTITVTWRADIAAYVARKIAEALNA